MVTGFFRARRTSPLGDAHRARLHGLAVEEAIKIVGKCAGRRIAPLGILLETGHHHGLEIARDSRVDGPQWGRLGFDQAEQDLNLAVAFERPRPAEQLVQNHSEGEDIGSAIDGAEIATRLLRRKVARCSHDLSGHGEPRHLLDPGDPEVEDIGVGPAVVIGHQDVGRFEVAVDETGGVGRLDRLRHSFDQQYLVLGGQLFRGHVQRLALDILHGDVGPTLVLADLVHLAHRRVVDPCLRPRLAHQPLDQDRVVVAQVLQGDVSLEIGIPGLEDLAHAAGTDRDGGLVFHR